MQIKIKEVHQIRMCRCRIRINTEIHHRPLFLHLNESPNQVLISPIFTCSNYYTSARSMEKSLISKNKFKFINGLITRPDEFHPLFDA